MKAEVLSLARDGSLVLPSDYRLELGLRDQVLCSLEEGQIVIRPFYEDLAASSKSLLDQLREEGFKDQDLLDEYKRRKNSQNL